MVVGTRPEVIKQAPVYLACRDLLGTAHVSLIGTGQHRDLLDQALAHFSLELDTDLHVMLPDQTPLDTAAAVLAGLEPLMVSRRPSAVVVQGDTTTAAMAAWAAFHHGIVVAHNEAGLRTGDLAQPFPEEANRRLISMVADLHFAPTEHARDVLLDEGIAPAAITVTGNPGIDAMRMTLDQPVPRRARELLDRAAGEGRELIFMTAHRKENRGSRMEEWFSTLASFLDAHEELELVYPMHPNQAGAEAAHHHLREIPGVRLIEPLDYAETCHLLRRCRFVITDSGGIQEEASTLGVPVVVCRATTERPEAVVAGASFLAGTDPGPLSKGLSWAHELGGRRYPDALNPIFGDGHAAPRIAQALQDALT